MTLDLIEAAVLSAKVTDGRSLRSAAGRNVISVTASNQSYKWQPWEDEYLKKNLGRMSEEDIAKHLGRTIIGVHLRWMRDLNLTATSKRPDVITGQQAANMLGIDVHKIMHWCDVGMIKARRMRGTWNDRERVIRLIDRTAFHMWVVNPNNWIYFDWKKIVDPHLRRLCELRAERWGDEWWTNRQVSDHHGVTTKDVLRLITKKKTLPAVQVETSLSGRHKDPFWLNWFVKKSDAVKAEFIRGRGNGHVIKFTPRAEAWMLKAYMEFKMPYEVIARSMRKGYAGETIKKNIIRLLAGKELAK